MLLVLSTRRLYHHVEHVILSGGLVCFCGLVQYRSDYMKGNNWVVISRSVLG